MLAAQALQLRQRQAVAGLGQQGAGVACGQPVFQRLPCGLALGAAALAGGGVGVEHHGPGQGAAGLGVAHDDAIAGQGAGRGIQHQLGVAFMARLQGAVVRVAQGQDVAGAVPGAQVQVDGGPAGQRGVFCQPVQAHVQAGAGGQELGLGQPVAPGDVAGVDAGQIQGHALPRAAGGAGAVLRVQAAHAHAAPGAGVGQAVAHADLPAKHGAGDDGALPGQAEGAIHRQAEEAAAAAGRAVLGLLHEVLAQGIGAGVVGPGGGGGKQQGAGHGGDAEDGCHFFLHFGDALGRHAVGLGDGDAGAADAQQLQDLHVLQRLRHDAIVRCDDQQGVVDADGPCGHGVDEFLVAGHVDDAQHLPIGQRQVGVAQLDADAALLLLFEPVGVGAGQRAHQGGFAVVDVPGGADDHGGEIFNKK